MNRILSNLEKKKDKNYAGRKRGASMKPVDRQKMCPNCDGRVPYDATQCPFCFATLQVDNSGSPLKNQSIQDSLTNYYTPPYAAEEKRLSKSVEKEIPQAAPTPKAVSAQVPDTRAFWPILLLTLGGNLFTLGILQFFFSDNGLVTLEIPSAFWFLYVVAAAPLFYLGLKQANRSQ